MTPLLIAALCGLLIGLSLGALGGGGSVLAVPVLVYLLGQSPTAATTGALVVVGVSSLVGVLAASRGGNVHVGRGIVFGLVGMGTAALGARWSVRVDGQLLLAGFSAVMLVVAMVMLVRQLRGGAAASALGSGSDHPVLSFTPVFACDCPRLLKVVVVASLVGVMTGFFGVGGGFLVVPALVLVLNLSMPVAVGTSLLVISINSAAALTVRLSHDIEMDWAPVMALVATAMLGSVLGARLSARLNPRVLGVSFSLLLLSLGGYMAASSVAGLLL